MNEENNIISDYPEGLMNFIKNYNALHPGKDAKMHNLYILRSQDMDGNITQTAYGINLLTNLGFDRVRGTGFTSYNTSNYRLYIGKGTTEPQLTDTAIESPITTSGSIDVSKQCIFYPEWYEPETNILYGQTKIYEGYFDYNISGVTEDQIITEVGIGPSTTTLWSHAKIYDESATNTTNPIIKKINERLIITVFYVLCMKPDFITNAYNNGTYVAMSPARMVYRFIIGDPSSPGGDYKNIGVAYSRREQGDPQWGTGDFIDDTSKSTVSDNVSTATYRFGTSTSIYLENNNCFSLLKAGMNHYAWRASPFDSPHTLMLMQTMKSGLKLSSPETIECDKIYTNSYGTLSLTDTFGHVIKNVSTSENSKHDDTHYKGMLPCMQFDIKQLFQYNHLTKAWDIEETFESNPDYDYTPNRMTWCVYRWTYVPTGIAKTTYVFINTMTEFPIKTFSGATGVIYATDKYWDPREWILIQNLSSLSEDTSNRRYYIRIENSDPLYPTYNCTKHAITTTNQLPSPITGLPGSSSDYWWTQYISTSEENSCIVRRQALIYDPEDDSKRKIYQVSFYNNSSGSTWYDTLNHHITEDGLRLLMLTNNIKKETLRVYVLSTDHTVEPTFNDVQLTFTSTDLTYNIRTFNDRGFYVSCNRAYKETVILDLNGDENNIPTQTTITNANFGVTLNRSNYCVYLDTNVIIYNSIKIYDMTTKQIVDEFSIPLDYTVNGISGWSDFVYVNVNTGDTYSTFVYNIQSNKLDQLDINIGSINMTVTSSYFNSYKYNFSCDECFVVCTNTRTVTRPTGWVVFTRDNPTSYLTLLNTSDSNLNKNVSVIDLHHSSDDKHLYLTCYNASSYHYGTFIIDLGYIIDTNAPLTYLPETGFNSYRPTYGTNNNDNIYNSFVYKNWLIVGYGTATSAIVFYHLQAVIRHKIIGETYTIQSYNNPKNISSLNRTMTFKMSNDTSKWE